MTTQELSQKRKMQRKKNECQLFANTIKKDKKNTGMSTNYTKMVKQNLEDIILNIQISAESIRKLFSFKRRNCMKNKNSKGN